MARKRRRKRKKSWPLAIVEFAGAYAAICIIRVTPMAVGRFVAHRAGDAFYLLWGRRRRIAQRNVQTAFPEITDQREIRRIAHRACRSMFLTGLWMLKLRRVFHSDMPKHALEAICPGFSEKLRRIQQLYREVGGFVFVTGHLGNWENLIHIADTAGIPLVVVARPLDNPLLHKLIYDMRLSSNQHFVGKRNVFFQLKNAIRRGKCVAVLGDQRAGKRGVMAPFFGKPASTHPTPALLAYHFNRPIVVLAACRTKTGFDGLMSEPIWPKLDAPEEDEILRLTTTVNETLAEFIRKHPDQYLWAHDRWRDV